ncbi:hypothetical protein NADFUDRAFT_19326 [Nadsonia fulvescens var. elongata DSM 6958]|uniref:Alpha-mannosidase n=1 Tax=Nadsonia fulvescens var. elongata DSM 6958 TaxID=857566 RepID=A0A1E3PRI3_9ASCO|nr:hypothetical protein NADFUDRAFT_19326 [Nadsonia fulvescens var. elongata DSM 6958]
MSSAGSFSSYGEITQSEINSFLGSENTKRSNYPVYSTTPVAKKVKQIYEDRLRQFTSKGEYSKFNLPAFYDRARTDATDYIQLETYPVPDCRRPLFHDALKEAQGNWVLAKKGDSFGPSWTTHWFKVKFRVPRNSSIWKEANQILFNWDCGNEGMIFTEDGKAQVGLSGEERREWIIPENWTNDSKWHTIYIETSCNGMFGNADPNNNIQPPQNNRYFSLVSADLVVPNLPARALFVDFWIIGDSAREFRDESWQKHKAREVANQIMDAFDPNNPDETIEQCRQIARTYLGCHVDSPDVFKGDSVRDKVIAIGNCHIDTAWLWPYAETRRKIGRSWASQLDLIKRYPEYRFVASQAQQFKWLAQDYPDLFDRIKQEAKNGSFIPIGGSWVECDTNMPTGEALVRQFLLGQRFFLHHFGKKCRTFWLPDTFGYSAQIPQLCRGADLDRFLTQKLSWNNINNFPNTTFNWVSPDGTQVLTHMPPDNTYTAPAHLGDVARSLRTHKNLDITQTGLLVYGHGDGGGGPTDEMLEKLRRCRGLSDTVGELPRVKLGSSVDDFFDSIECSTDHGKNLVTWNGELYFEFHRGTYTSQSDTKKGNRLAEIMMHDLEFITTLASIQGAADYIYPKREIDDLWEDVCLNQFHDVLPGSSIEMVYEDVKKIYMHAMKTGEKLARDALKALDISVDLIGNNSEIVAINTMPWGRSEVVKVPTSNFKTIVASETFVCLQTTQSGLAKIQKFEAFRGKTMPCATVEEVEDGVFVMQNSRIRATIIGGTVTSLIDKQTDREIIASSLNDDGIETRGNQFVLFDDQPLNWQAWDTEVFSLNKRKNIPDGKVRITHNGPLKAAVEVEHKISDKSTIINTISLNAYIPPNEDDRQSELNIPDVSYLEFACEVDWHEECKFLKVEFPVDITCEYGTYESQFGLVRRPTHYNTSWDVAKFEVCTHKWSDLSEYNYGVSILNDCKYGFSIHGNVMRLSLLRSPKAPDANADMGTHSFRYAILPHKGQLNADVVRAAYNFNHPLDSYYIPRRTPAAEAADKLLKSIGFEGDKNLILSNIKRFEDDKDISRGELEVRYNGKSIIVRIYDSLGTKSKGFITLKYGLKIKKVWKCNLLEEDIGEIEETSIVYTCGNDGEVIKIPVEIRPFQVCTYRIELT